MTLDFQKVADAIEKSSKEIKDLMFSTELGDKIGKIAETNKLEEEVAFKFIDEVGYVILDLKSRSTFFDSLVEIGVDKNVAMTITKEVESKIFSELDKVKTKTPEKQEQSVTPTTPNTNISMSKSAQQNVGKSFEQIILNQARAMQPARNTSPNSASMTSGPAVAPANLPIEKASEMPIQRPIEREETTTPNQPHIIHNYSGSSDPYREPVE